MQKLGVIITCHNRKEFTLRCLESLFRCSVPDGINMRVYLTDDGCSDGTPEAINSNFPQVIITHADGNQYWGGGMRTSMQRALRDNVDYFLWLNDDVVLNGDALTNGFRVLSRNEKALAVGTTVDPNTGELTYGGLQAGVGRATSFKVMQPDENKKCRFMSGQFVLFPLEVTNKIGLIDPIFRHSFGDVDFGLRAGKAGFRLIMIPQIIGTCATNPNLDYWKQGEDSLNAFLDKLNSPKGLPPKERIVYCRRHCGIFWWWHFISPYALYALSWPRYAKKRR